MKKTFLYGLLFLSCHISFAQVAALDPKGAKKVRIETTNYTQNDSSKTVQVLYFDSKGNVTRSVKYDAANDPLELWTHSYKYKKDGSIKSSQSKFKDHTKQLKSQKFKTEYSYTKEGKLLKVENTSNLSGYECGYDSVGNLGTKNDYNAKGFYGGAKYFYANGQVVKQKYEWGNKPPETTEFTYDAKGRRTKAVSSRGQKKVKKEDYSYED